MAKTVRAMGPGIPPLPAYPLRIFPSWAHYPQRILPIDRTGYQTSRRSQGCEPWPF